MKQQIMSTKPAIRIIKREERHRREKSAEIEATTSKKTAQETAREMVATVTEWVTELQHKRRTETARAIKILLPKTSPQPNEI